MKVSELLEKLKYCDGDEYVYITLVGLGDVDVDLGDVYIPDDLRVFLETKPLIIEEK